jgi:hypothetical protein
VTIDNIVIRIKGDVLWVVGKVDFKICCQSVRTCQGGKSNLSQSQTNHSPRFNTSLLLDYDMLKRVGCDMLYVN